MRILGVCAILLTLAAVAPPPALRGPFEPLWALGALVLLAVTLHRATNRGHRAGERAPLDVEEVIDSFYEMRSSRR